LFPFFVSPLFFRILKYRKNNEICQWRIIGEFRSKTGVFCGKRKPPKRLALALLACIGF